MDKKQILNVKNFINSDQVPHPRLSSLHFPRDLRVGGTNPKKVYAPNLNIVRNKCKNVDPIKKPGHAHLNKANSKSQHRNISSDRYVQCNGIFSEGSSEVKRSSLRSDRHITLRDKDFVSDMVIPVVKNNNWNVINKAAESIIADELLGNDSESDSSENDYVPVVLPLEQNSGSFSSVFKVKKDIETKIKLETEENIPKVTDFYGSDNAKSLINTNYEWHMLTALNGKQAYDDDSPAYSIIKLPVSFTGKGFSDDPKEKKYADYTLNEMPGGEIGTILVRKSGKMEVNIGNTNYMLEPEECGKFREEIVFVKKSETISNVDNVCYHLGFLEDKFALAPDWEQVFTRKKFKK